MCRHLLIREQADPSFLQSLLRECKFLISREYTYYPMKAKNDESLNVTVADGRSVAVLGNA